jgi:formylglycine-generating enzyme required for sulfatase activity
LALLNACEGARVGTSDPFAGVAQHLVLQGIPAIIAMQFEITDNAAMILAQEFYGALADGYPVEAALAEARKAIFVAGHEVEWGTPVLYSRASDGLLFKLASLPEREPPGREAKPVEAKLVEAAKTETPTNAPITAANLPGRGDPDSQSKQTSVAPIATPIVTPTPLSVDGDKFTLDAFAMTFAYVSAGPFTMGSPSGEGSDDEHPQHEMPVDAFWIGLTEVTNAQYQHFIDAKGYDNQAWWTVAGWQWRTENTITLPAYWNDEKWNSPNQPVVGVSWYEAKAYVTWLAAETGLAIDLPTEAQWEKAARGTDGRIYPWGDESPSDQLLNFNSNVGKTVDVGSYLDGASPYGALDMAGNVWEWTATKWVGNYDNYATMVDNDKEGDATRALRGGAWYNLAVYVRSAYRRWDYPFFRIDGFGFRLVVFAPGG